MNTETEKEKYSEWGLQQLQKRVEEYETRLFMQRYEEMKKRREESDYRL